MGQEVTGPEDKQVKKRTAMRHIQRFVGDEYFVEYCNWDEVFDARRGDVAEVEVVGILVNERNGMVSLVSNVVLYG